MNFRKLGKNCPICNGARRGRGRGGADCRQSSNELIHCRTGLELSTIPVGWKFIKLDNAGFGLFAPDDSDWSDSQKQQWQQRIEADRKLRQNRLTLELASSLPVDGRNRAIKTLHKYLGLSQKHRQNLLARNLTDAQIEAGYFFTIHPNQELPPGIPANLPGVISTRLNDHAWGKLATKTPGFACPAFDVEGNIIGWQLRVDDATDNKYRWAKGWKSSHLPNGELPITVCRPVSPIENELACTDPTTSSERSTESVNSELVESVLRKNVGLAEGLLKPYIAAQKLGQIFIGAAGGNFGTIQLKASLDALKPDIITLYPDAGAVSNPHVMRRYQETINLIKGWGYALQVAWWGQIDKTHPDIDELHCMAQGSQPSASNSLEPSNEAASDSKSNHHQLPITYISPEKFFTLGDLYSGYTPSTQKPNNHLDTTISRDQWELNFSFSKHLGKRIKQALNDFKGFGKPPTPKPQPSQAPDQSFQDSNQRLTIWQKAIHQGYKYILDNSAPGLGKSYGVGIAIPDAFGVEKLWYISNDHRNPTTGVVETNYTDLPVRHKGLKQDFSRKTPNGNPFLRHPRTAEGEEPDTAPNCYRSDLFRIFSDKGYNVEGSKNSPICATCKVAHLCSQGIGSKYGATFRGERSDALTSHRIRAHADSLPIPETDNLHTANSLPIPEADNLRNAASSVGFDYANSGLFWDEIGNNLKPIKETRVNLQDFDRTFAELETDSPDLHELLKPLRLALRSLLTGEIKQPLHGFDDAAIRNLLPKLSDNLEELREIIDKLGETLAPDFNFLKNDPNLISNDEQRKLGISKSMQRFVNQEFKREAHNEFFEGLNNLLLNWLIPFLKVWTHFERGALRCEGKQLIIFTHNPKYSDIALSARFNIFLDATITREQLALLLGVERSEIYVVRQEMPNHQNLKIVQVTGMGKLGKVRSESLQERVVMLRKALGERYPGIVFGDWKCQSEDGDGQWFVNLRGSNEFKDAPAMAVLGVPYQNVGYLQALYQTMEGEYAPLDKQTPHEGLQRFIDAYVEAEIEQAVGRLRAHVRPNEQLTFIFVGDYDLSFLGVPVEQVEAFQICPEAGTPTQISRWKILEAMRLLKEQGEKITQQAIAYHAGISQPLIAKIAAQFGGWGHLKKILLALLDPFYSDSNNFDALDDEEKWLAQTYLPILLDEPTEEAVQNIGQIIQGYGISAFLRLLSVSGFQTQAKLLALVLQGLPEIFLRDFLPYIS